ncbi:MAG: hypothetical protein HY885_09905 [Deltaproteobacteria bacterium]|nr:hypothetical protein [Deltaproteobacteria bacterium]
MPKETIQKKLLALYHLTSEQLAEFLQGGPFDDYAVRVNEFEVFCAFWATACYLHSPGDPDKDQVEHFNKSIIFSIVDRVSALHPDELDEEQIDSLVQTITNVFIERFSTYRECFQSDVKQQEKGSYPLFPCLVDGFLVNILDRPVPEQAHIRQLLDSFLEEMLDKSIVYFSS